MGKRMIEQFFGASAGEEVTVNPDLVLITNGFSRGVTELAGRVAIRDKVLVMYDHNVPSGSPEDARVYGEILCFARKYNLSFRQAKGVALQYLANEVVKPGQIVITGTRHAAILGAKGALGIGISNTELARVLENGKYHVIVPQTVGVKVIGSLPEGKGIIDAALTFLQDNPNLQGKAIEFAGGTLSQHEKEVLCYMACDTGAYTAVWSEEGETEICLDLSRTRSMLRTSCAEVSGQTKAGIVETSVLEGRTIHAGQIGGVNGGTIDDLRKAAALMEGKRLKRRFRLTICPATSADYIKAMEEGIVTRFIDFHAQISAAGDHSVVPQGAGAMGPKETLLTTGLYTYSGCMGCNDAEIYTASLETIMAAATEDI